MTTGRAEVSKEIVDQTAGCLRALARYRINADRLQAGEPVLSDSVADACMELANKLDKPGAGLKLTTREQDLLASAEKHFTILLDPLQNRSVDPVEMGQRQRCLDGLRSFRKPFQSKVTQRSQGRTART